MDRPRYQKTEAIVLKHVNIGEGDRIITFYTPLGKVRAVARGVRKVKSRLAGHLELLTRTQVLLQRGKSLDAISQSETLEGNLEVRQDLWRMTCGLYLAELVERFTQDGQENPELYDLLRESLDALAAARDPDLLLRSFEMRLLVFTGYQPELTRCVECGIALSPSAHQFSPSAGGVLCASCGPKHALRRPLTLNALKVLRLLARSGYQTASGVRIPEELAVELEGVIRQYMRYLLEQEVKSTDFLDLIRREGGTRSPPADSVG